jgi:hypothetical protein
MTRNPFYTQLNGGWVNTASIVADVEQAAELFAPIASPQPGAVVVFKATQGERHGHAGIVVSAGESAADARVIHCSVSNYRAAGTAVVETTADVFDHPGLVVAWFVGLRGWWTL